MSDDDEMSSNNNPWAKFNAQPHEWLFAEDSYAKSLNKPVRIFKQCQYVETIYNRPFYSIENSQVPEGFLDLAVFASSESDDKFQISKRIVHLQCSGRVDVGDFVTLHIRGCCNIVGIFEE